MGWVDEPGNHTKACLSRALVCAVENARDDERITDIGFVLAAPDFLATALSYYDGLIDCVCRRESELAKCPICGAAGTYRGKMVWCPCVGWVTADLNEHAYAAAITGGHVVMARQ